MPECLFNASDRCHQVKKKQFVCKTCWAEASKGQQEKLKDMMPDYDYCASFGCWDFKAEGRYCREHDRLSVRVRSRSPVRKSRGAKPSSSRRPPPPPPSSTEEFKRIESERIRAYDWYQLRFVVKRATDEMMDRAESTVMAADEDESSHSS